MKAKKTIRDANAYATPLFDDEGFLKLDSNESDFGPSPKVLEALRSISDEDIKFYPFYGKLLDKLAKFHRVDVENIILTAGADEAICSILGAFLEQEQTVLTVKPSFVMPKIYSKIKGLNYKEVQYQDKWVFPENEFIESIECADLVHITTPNSPTGEIIERETICRILEKSGDKAVLIDETYANYSGVTNLDLLLGRENVFVVRSFSKDFALAGLRLGYIISAKENIVELRKALSPYNVSSLAVKAGLAALDDLAYFDYVKGEIEKSKEILVEGLAQIAKNIYPSKTNFLCVDFGEKADFIYKKLLDSKIKVRNFNNAPLLENCFRIGVPKPKNAQKILDAVGLKPTIVFDMDGVLIDASKSYRVSIQKTILQMAGIEVSAQEISDTKKLGGLNNDWDLTEFLLKKYGFEFDKQEIIDVFQSYYEKLAEIEQPLVDCNFFEKLSQNYNLAIFTGRVREEAYYTLEKHGFTKYFYPIITMQEVGLDHQKPDTLGIEIIKEKIITDKIYYLGDTVDDMVCAQNAGVCGIGILPPQDQSDELRELLKSKNAVVVLNQALDLIEFMEQKENAKV